MFSHCTFISACYVEFKFNFLQFSCVCVCVCVWEKAMSLQEPHSDIHKSNEDTIRAAGKQKETMVIKYQWDESETVKGEGRSTPSGVTVGAANTSRMQLNLELYQDETKQRNMSTQTVCVLTLESQLGHKQSGVNIIFLQMSRNIRISSLVSVSLNTAGSIQSVWSNSSESVRF